MRVNAYPANQRFGTDPLSGTASDLRTALVALVVQETTKTKKNKFESKLCSTRVAVPVRFV